MRDSGRQGERERERQTDRQRERERERERERMREGVRTPARSGFRMEKQSQANLKSLQFQHVLPLSWLIEAYNKKHTIKCTSCAPPSTQNGR